MPHKPAPPLPWPNKRNAILTNTYCPLSLAGAATSKFFVATNTCLSLQNTSFVAINIIFVTTKDVFCRDKHVFVETKVCLLQQNFCHEKHMFVATKLLSRQTCLSRQTYCREKHIFVATKTCFVTTTMILVATQHTWVPTSTTPSTVFL